MKSEYDHGRGDCSCLVVLHTGSPWIIKHVFFSEDGRQRVQPVVADLAEDACATGLGNRFVVKASCHSISLLQLRHTQECFASL